MTSPSRGVWLAPYRASQLNAAVTVPGSKSVTNRALLLAALADSPSAVGRPLLARDTRLMMSALRALGCGIEEQPDGGSVTVTPHPFRGPASIDCGLAGTVMRFVPPVAALATGEVTFDGDPAARARPMGEMLNALRILGADIETPAAALPFTVSGSGRMRGGTVTLDASASSQFVSALLLAGARYDLGVDLRHVGKPLPSLPHIAMTVDMLRERGVSVDDSEPDRWAVSPGPVKAVNVEVEPDLSSAAPFLAAAVVRGGTVAVRGWPVETSQPGDQLRWILALFGATVAPAPVGLVVTGSGSVDGVDIDLHEVGELTPVLAAVAAVARGPSYLRGVAHLRGHETDRLAALTSELRRLGADVHETADGLHIRPATLHGGRFRTYGDHRLAHAAAVLGLVVPGVEVEDVSTTAKTFPGFPEAWVAMAG
ncbi:MAG: 3-phosphoshikimate 1-carboxyvinyltransferase [Nocardioidaceae bacterium]|nr:3-phosphoshikimate 1-carboxyvinyltransferase [Nocardioidaceae bacterium]